MTQAGGLRMLIGSLLLGGVAACASGSAPRSLPEPEGLSQAERFLSGTDDGVAERFQRGLALARMGRDHEAISHFHALTLQRPELREPHYNLGVMRARIGDIEGARSALLDALNLDPGYTEARDSLASLEHQLVGGSEQLPRPESLVAEPEPMVAEPEPMVTEPEPTVTEPEPMVAEPEPMVAEPADSEAPALAELRAALEDWERAWEAQDVPAYIGSYIRGYAPEGSDHDHWVAEREPRVRRPARIVLTLDEVEIELVDDARARVRFVQHYRSDRYSDRVHKELEMVRTAAGWRIVGERVSED